MLHLIALRVVKTERGRDPYCYRPALVILLKKV